MEIKIKPEQLAGTIQEILHSMPMHTENIIDEATNVVSKKAVKELRETSPKRTGNYAKGWTRKKEKGRTIIYNEGYSWLAHLLENGHDIIKNGKKVGYSEPRKHIKPVEKMVQEEMTKEVERRLEEL